MLKQALICGLLVIGLGGGLPADVALAQTSQARSLADIRQELSVLYFEIQRLRLELSTTGGPSLPAGTANPLSRLDAIEAELRRMTAATETLQLRIEAIVQDGTNWNSAFVNWNPIAISQHWAIRRPWAVLPPVRRPARPWAKAAPLHPRQAQAGPVMARNWPLQNNQILTAPLQLMMQTIGLRPHKPLAASQKLIRAARYPAKRISFAARPKCSKGRGAVQPAPFSTVSQAAPMAHARLRPWPALGNP